MIRTYDELLLQIKQSRKLAYDILDNIKLQNIEVMQVGETRLSFDFKNQFVTIHRESNDPLVLYKSPDVKILFSDFEELLHSFI